MIIPPVHARRAFLCPKETAPGAYRALRPPTQWVGFSPGWGQGRLNRKQGFDFWRPPRFQAWYSEVASVLIGTAPNFGPPRREPNGNLSRARPLLLPCRRRVEDHGQVRKDMREKIRVVSAFTGFLDRRNGNVVGSHMSSLQRRIAAITNLVGQLRELDRLRDRVWKAQLTARRSRRRDRRKRRRV
jgi:hypothetical protein